MRLISERKTLAGQLAILIALAFAIAAALFVSADRISTKAISKYLEASSYVERQNDMYAEKLQEFVTENGISSTDRKALGEWTREQKRIWFEIYKGRSWIYTSIGPFEGESTESDYTDEIHGYKIEFGDGTFDVELYGNYTYQFYYHALIAELDVCFAIFFFIVMAGVSRMIKYVRKLREEIEILEGGNLEYEVTVKGRNELAALGESIDAFRKSILQQFEKEEELKELNSRMITDMSHDIRTPLTAVMIYTEAIKHGKYESQEQLMHYVDRIDDKLHRIKYLTDRIFEYSLENDTAELPDVEDTFRNVFSDALSGVVEYLEQQGFRIEAAIEWYDREVSVYSEDLDRILNNIVSNIVKYADAGEPVKIRSVSQDGYAGFVFENTVSGACEGFKGGTGAAGCDTAGMAVSADAPGCGTVQASGDGGEIESRGIGLRSVMKLMERVGGLCDIEQDSETFSISVMFRG